jgi:hypothetical protein
MVGGLADVGTARADAERMMELGRPVTYEIVQSLLSGLCTADTEIVQLRAERDHWQDAYCEARLEARLRRAREG